MELDLATVGGRSVLWVVDRICFRQAGVTRGEAETSSGAQMVVRNGARVWLMGGRGGGAWIEEELWL